MTFGPKGFGLTSKLLALLTVYINSSPGCLFLDDVALNNPIPI
jgi:hypothetical protein